ncbi:hypothetical protein FRC04_000573 [Tulasnella sp. 424]|nr:hypothetical protein FRC04_000573 [Tulasnella sp. 424]KAG8967908.1 hypothetical protein FRC05_001873 [Tulasnella sp. 425]
MSQQTNQSSSPSTNTNSASPSTTVHSQAPSAQRPSSTVNTNERVVLADNISVGVSRLAANPGQTSQVGRPESTEFDFTLSPGAEQWQLNQTADGRAVYSTVDAGVTVEFQKWDW